MKPWKQFRVRIAQSGHRGCSLGGRTCAKFKGFLSGLLRYRRCRIRSSKLGCFLSIFRIKYMVICQLSYSFTQSLAVLGMFWALTQPRIPQRLLWTETIPIIFLEQSEYQLFCIQFDFFPSIAWIRGCLLSSLTGSEDILSKVSSLLAPLKGWWWAIR